MNDMMSTPVFNGTAHLFLFKPLQQTERADAMDLQLFLALYCDAHERDQDLKDKLLADLRSEDRDVREFNAYIARNQLSKTPDATLKLDSPTYEANRLLLSLLS